MCLHCLHRSMVLESSALFMENKFLATCSHTMDSQSSKYYHSLFLSQQVQSLQCFKEISKNSIKNLKVDLVVVFKLFLAVDLGHLNGHLSDT